jgi:hypothetical protein
VDRAGRLRGRHLLRHPAAARRPCTTATTRSFTSPRPARSRSRTSTTTVTTTIDVAVQMYASDASGTQRKPKTAADSTGGSNEAVETCVVHFGCRRLLGEGQDLQAQVDLRDGRGRRLRLRGPVAIVSGKGPSCKSITSKGPSRSRAAPLRSSSRRRTRRSGATAQEEAEEGSYVVLVKATHDTGTLDHPPDCQGQVALLERDTNVGRLNRFTRHL